MRRSTLLLLSSALGATAQSMLSSSMGTTTVTVDVYADCTDSATMNGIDTITSTITETACPLCTDMPTKQHTTVYETVFDEVCSTGLRGKTWTVTESCPTACDRGDMAADYVPQGFTTTVQVCTVCAGKPTPVTLTVPCTETPAAAGAGMPTPPAMATPTAAAPMANNAMSAAGSTPTAAVPPPVCAGNGTCPSMMSNSTMPTAGMPKADSFPGAASKEVVGKMATLVAVGLGLFVSHYLL